MILAAIFIFQIMNPNLSFQEKWNNDVNLYTVAIR